MLDSHNKAATMGNNGNSAPAATNSPLSEPSIQTSCPTPLAAPVNNIDADIPF